MIIGITGTQSGLSTFQRDEIPRFLKDCTELVHGDCIGVDKEVNAIALELGIKQFTIFPPDNPKKRAWVFNSKKEIKLWDWNDSNAIKIRWFIPLPYLERNKKIVDHCNILVAMPKESEHSLRSGTWATIRYAWKRAKQDETFKVIIIPPR